MSKCISREGGGAHYFPNILVQQHYQKKQTFDSIRFNSFLKSGQIDLTIREKKQNFQKTANYIKN